MAASMYHINLADLTIEDAFKTLDHIDNQLEAENQRGISREVSLERPRELIVPSLPGGREISVLSRCSRQSTRSNGSRHLSVSPTNSMHSAIAPQSPLSMIGMYREHRASIGNITMVSPTHSMHGILEENEVAMECSESRENADKICMFTMDTWSDPEFAEFLRLIGQQNCIQLFRVKGIESEHFMKIDEAALRSMELPPVHCRNLLEQRDYYLECDETMQSLPDDRELSNMDRVRMEQKLVSIKSMLKKARISRRKSKNKRCTHFERKHHDQIQTLKALVEAMETELAVKIASEMHQDDEKQAVLEKVDGENSRNGIEGQCITTETGYSDFEENEDVRSPGKVDVDVDLIAMTQNIMQSVQTTVRPERELVSGCNAVRSCVGVVSLQSMNMNYVRLHFGESSQEMLALSLEKNLLNAVDGVLARFGGGLRANLYKNDDLMAYTLILWNADPSNECMTKETFTGFLKSDLIRIGQQIPMSWQPQSGNRAVWQQQSERDIYCDLKVLTKHEQHRSMSSQLEFEGIDGSDIEYSCSMSKSAYSQSAYSRNEMVHQKSASNLSNLSVASAAGQSPMASVDLKKPKKHKRSSSKTKKFMKTLAKPIKRLSMRKRKSKKAKCSLVDLDELHELRKHGMDNDAVSPNVKAAEERQVYFTAGSVFVAHEEVNLYQVIQSVRGQINKTLSLRRRRSQKSGHQAVADESNLLFVNSI